MSSMVEKELAVYLKGGRQWGDLEKSVKKRTALKRK